MPPRSQLVLGTAGHIDHGKTALIRALTGIDTDRLPEEKARGITIDLGFAPLDLSSELRVSVVDVPGHEGLVRTMVAGATGIDLVLLVVAADEGVMPQTREHVAICDLLGIDRGVVALTKIDTVPEDVQQLAAQEIAELLEGTTIAGAPLCPVAALSGQGIPLLRGALLEVATHASPRTARSGVPRLPIDRVFAVKGFGTVVTGTLVGGALSVGDAVAILPSGATTKIRGLQSFGEVAESVAPGARCAVNVQGLEVAELHRGELLTTPEALVPTRAMDVELAWLAQAPALAEPMSVEFLVGTAERRARLAPIGRGEIAPGAQGFARVHVEGEPLAVLPGDRFVVRGFARTTLGGSTLGGGMILDVAPPRRRLTDPALLEDLETLARGDLESDLVVRIARSGLAGIAGDALSRELGMSWAALIDCLEAPATDGRILPTSAGRWLGAQAVAALERRVMTALAVYHAAEPLQPGMTRGALRGRLPDNVANDGVDLALSRLVAARSVVAEGDRVRHAEHQPSLSHRDQEIAEKILDEARAGRLEPPTPREWAERHAIAPAELRELLAHLEREGKLVRAPGDLFFDAGAVAALREAIVAHLEAHGSLDTPTYKALIGTTRRYAVPLMELFDGERLTLRTGEVRVLRDRSRRG